MWRWEGTCCAGSRAAHPGLGLGVPEQRKTLQITFQHQKGWERQQSPHRVHVGKHKLSQGHNNNHRCAQKHREVPERT